MYLFKNHTWTYIIKEKKKKHTKKKLYNYLWLKSINKWAIDITNLNYANFIYNLYITFL